jgi:hypothetical protein
MLPYTDNDSTLLALAEKYIVFKGWLMKLIHLMLQLMRKLIRSGLGS